MIQSYIPFRVTQWLLAALFSILFLPARAQQFGFSKEMQFVRYLQDKEMYSDAKVVLSRVHTAGLSQAQLDTLNYLSGWGAYSAKHLDSAAADFLQVTPLFPLYVKSRFFAAYCLAFNARADSSLHLLHHLALTDSVDKEMQAFQSAGLALLTRDYAAFRQLQPQFTYSYYAMQQQEQRLNEYYKKLSGYNRKSPLLAGLYSAVIPGAGKFYAGKKKQGIAAFLPVLSLAAITYEAYRRGGIRSARFITFGSLFSVFYIGNIWGSVLSVNIKKKEFYREYDNKILFDLHIPLRNLYN